MGVLLAAAAARYMSVLVLSCCLVLLLSTCPLRGYVPTDYLSFVPKTQNSCPGPGKARARFARDPAYLFAVLSQTQPSIEKVAPTQLE